MGLTGKLERYPIAPNASIKVALEPVKLCEGMCKGGCDIGSRFAVQTCAWISRAPAAAFRRERLTFRAVWAWLCGLFRPKDGANSGAKGTRTPNPLLAKSRHAPR